jgi:hypothetical protein
MGEEKTAIHSQLPFFQQAPFQLAPLNSKLADFLDPADNSRMMAVSSSLKKQPQFQDALLNEIENRINNWLADEKKPELCLDNWSTTYLRYCYQFIEKDLNRMTETRGQHVEVLLTSLSKAVEKKINSHHLGYCEEIGKILGTGVGLAGFGSYCWYWISSYLSYPEDFGDTLAIQALFLMTALLVLGWLAAAVSAGVGELVDTLVHYIVHSIGNCISHRFNAEFQILSEIKEGIRDLEQQIEYQKHNLVPN